METPQDDEQATVQGDTASDGSKPKRYAGLRPPWRPGQTGNPRGLARDGGGTKDYPIRAALRAKAKKRQNLKRLIDSWWDAACDGSDAAREQILKRLDPVTDDNSSGRQVVYEGLVIETPNGARAELVRGLVQALDQDVAGSRSEDVTLSTEAVVVHGTEESCGGATTQPVCTDGIVVGGREESYVGSAHQELYLEGSSPADVEPGSSAVPSDRSVASSETASSSEDPDHESLGFGPQAPA